MVTAHVSHTPLRSTGQAAATNVLDVLRARGFVAQVSDEDALRAAFDRGPVTIYQGFDPTATGLHTGNLVGIMALAHFQRAGHRPIALVGGGTGMIGDPSERASERPLLSVEAIQRNLAGIRTQFSRYLDFSDDRALLLNNADWLLELRWIEFLRDVGRHFTVNQLMQHGTYRERFETGSFSFIELNYALVQAYDFLHLYREHNCIVQLGGNDQWFNILAGRDLIHHAQGGEAFAVTTPLITTTTSGEKLGKTAGNAVWLDPTRTAPYDYYQYWRNTEDADVGRFMRMFTFLPLEEVAEYERRTGADLNAAKEVLAFEATRITHGEEEARKAQGTTRARFGGEGDDQGPSVSVRRPTSLVELALQAGLVESRNGAKRHLQTGGLKLDGQTQSSDRLVDPAELPRLLSVGKRKVRLVAASDADSD